MEKELRNKRKLNINVTYLQDIERILLEQGYESLVTPLDKLSKYVVLSFKDVEKKLEDSNLDGAEEKELLDMLRLMERKFDHILQVIEIANNLAKIKGYKTYQVISNILVAILHDIGRCMEIHKVGTNMALKKLIIVN